MTHFTQHGDIRSWGRVFRYPHRTAPLYWSADAPGLLRAAPEPVLAHGLGRSYGDVCLNENGALILTPGMDRLIAFDPHRGVVHCQAGVSLAALLAWSVPRGWFVPVTPGSQFVTIGGAIANDVHGKNHHAAGTFGCHVESITLLRSDGDILVLTPHAHTDLFRATIGGLGLTGLILSAGIRMKPVSGPTIASEAIKFSGLEEFFELAGASDRDYEYTVAWVDTLAAGRALGRGIFFRGNHAGPEATTAPGTVSAPAAKPRFSVPLNAPNWALNRWTIRAFNFAYDHKQLTKTVHQRIPYEPFFYPLDAVGQWNRIYGTRGFFQYQFVVPPAARAAVREALDAIARSGLGSFLAVLKYFGERPSPGLLSFPMPGITLALDFPNQGARTQRLFEILDALVAKAGGRLYPAKDSHMSKSQFQAAYPQWRQLETLRDPKFSSSFWRRVTS